MSQAAVACLKNYNIYSAQFSSCCPVILFNADTADAGYYHMPGKSNAYGRSTFGPLYDRDKEIIGDMAAAVNPTHVWVYPGKSVLTALQSSGPMTDALNAVFVGKGLQNVEVEIPEEPTGTLGITLKGSAIDFSRYPIDHDGINVYDSKRQSTKQPSDNREIMFWGWDVDVTGFMQLS